jgi:hypothetical protein
MLNDNTVLGYTAKGVKICYSDFKKNIYIIRSIAPRTLTPEGARVVVMARQIDPFVDATMKHCRP